MNPFQAPDFGEVEFFPTEDETAFIPDMSMTRRKAG